MPETRTILRLLPGLATSPAILLISWSLISLALASGEGTYEPHLIAVVVVGCGLVLAAATVATGVGAHRWVVPPRTAMLLSSLSALLVAVAAPPGVYRGSVAWVAISWAVAALTALCAVIAAVSKRWQRPVSMATWLLFPLGSLAIVKAAAKPSNDVYNLSTQAVGGLLKHRNIYGLCWQQHSDPLTECHFPYMPGSALLEVPSRVLLADIRYGLALCMLLTAVLVYRMSTFPVGPALAALVLAQPRLLFMIEEAWTEPMVILALTAFIYAVGRGRTGWGVVLFAVALFTKQHVLLLLPLAMWWPAFGVLRGVLSASLAAAATLPWLVASPRDFLDDALFFNLKLAPRLDSLSLFTTLTRAGWEPPFVFVGGLTLLTLVCVMRAMPRTTVGFCLGGAVTLTMFTLFNKQSFFNEWSLLLTLLLVTCAVITSEGSPVRGDDRLGKDVSSIDHETRESADYEHEGERGDIEPDNAAEAEPVGKPKAGD